MSYTMAKPSRGFFGALLPFLLLTLAAASYAPWPMDQYNARRTGHTSSIYGPGRTGAMAVLWAVPAQSEYSYCLSAPILAFDALIFLVGAGALVAFDPASAAMLWTSPTLPACAAGMTIISDPVAGADGSIYVACGATIYAVNASAGGSLLWDRTAEGARPYINPLLLSGSYLYGADSMGHRFALNATTGAVCADTMAYTASVPPVALANGAVYGFDDQALGFSLLNGSLGNASVPVSLAQPWFLDGVGMTGMCVTRGGTAILGGTQLIDLVNNTYGYYPAVAAYDLATGALQWSTNLTKVLQGGTLFLNPAPLLFEPTPYETDAVVVMSDFDHGRWYGLNASNGEVIWTFNQSALPCAKKTEGSLDSTAIDADGVMYTALVNCLLALDVRSGALLWQLTLSQFAIGGLIISDLNNGTLFINSLDGLLAVGRAAPTTPPANGISAWVIAGAVVSAVAGTVLLAAVVVMMWRHWGRAGSGMSGSAEYAGLLGAPAPSAES